MLLKQNNAMDNIGHAETAICKAKTMLNYMTEKHTDIRSFDLTQGMTEEILNLIYNFPYMCTLIDIIYDYVCETHEYIKHAVRIESQDNESNPWQQ